MPYTPAVVIQKVQKRVYKTMTARLIRMPGGMATIKSLLASYREVTPESLILNYCQGLVPVDFTPKGPEWIIPETRAILPIGQLHHEKKTLQLVKKKRFEVRFNTAFDKVVHACAENRTGWLHARMQDVYIQLHAMGIAHSVEAWRNGKLVGGAFGVAFGGFFSGESTFHSESEAGKVIFYHLDQRLQQRGYLLHDAQFINPHLEKMGAYEMSQEEYMKCLAQALAAPVTFGDG